MEWTSPNPHQWRQCLLRVAIRRYRWCWLWLRDCSNKLQSPTHLQYGSWTAVRVLAFPSSTAERDWKTGAWSYNHRIVLKMHRGHPLFPVQCRIKEHQLDEKKESLLRKFGNGRKKEPRSRFSGCNAECSIPLSILQGRGRSGGWMRTIIRGWEWIWDESLCTLRCLLDELIFGWKVVLVYDSPPPPILFLNIGSSLKLLDNSI